MKTKLLALSIACATILFGQGTGTIHGTVKDSSGLPIPGATVTAILEERGTTRTITANPEGDYAAPLLPIGTYDVIMEATGFRTSRQNGITLNANENVRADATLVVWDGLRKRDRDWRSAAGG